MCPLRIEEIFENVLFKCSDFVKCFEITVATLVANGIVVDEQRGSLRAMCPLRS